jgi:hypothetical protein
MGYNEASTRARLFDFFLPTRLHAIQRQRSLVSVLNEQTVNVDNNGFPDGAVARNSRSSVNDGHSCASFHCYRCH